MAMSNDSGDFFNIHTNEAWFAREMVLDQSQFAVMYVSRDDLEGEVRVRNSRTGRSEVFANEGYAEEAFRTLNAAERERSHRLSRETQEQKERAGYGDW